MKHAREAALAHAHAARDVAPGPLVVLGAGHLLQGSLSTAELYPVPYQPTGQMTQAVPPPSVPKPGLQPGVLF